MRECVSEIFDTASGIFYASLVSKIHDIWANLVWEQKMAWAFLLPTVLSCALYVLTILTRMRHSDVLETLSYEVPLLSALGAAFVFAVIAGVVMAVMAPGEAENIDERDVSINYRGNSVAFSILVLGVLLVLGLSLGKVHHFWIANGAYMALVFASVAGTAVKLVAYERGV